MTPLEEACERRLKMIMTRVRGYGKAKANRHTGEMWAQRIAIESEVKKLIEHGLKFAGEGPLADVQRLGGPEVDETWTKADVKRLLRLLIKRRKIMGRLEELAHLEWMVEFETTTKIRRMIEGRR